MKATKKSSPSVIIVSYVIGAILSIAIMLAIRYGEYLFFSDHLNGISFWEYLWLFGGK